MASLAEINKIARSMGLTYGKYEAMLYEQNRGKEPQPPPVQTRRSRRRYTDEQAFALWQEGKNDCEIGIVLGVSRQIIQRWRDTMELPSTAKDEIDTSKYHLEKTGAGVFVIHED